MGGRAGGACVLAGMLGRGFAQKRMRLRLARDTRPFRRLSPPQDWLRMVERVLKLSIPCLYWWLAMFYTLFDLWLNILAEVLRFGDREFYKVGRAARRWAVEAYGGMGCTGLKCPERRASRRSAGGLIWRQARSTSSAPRLRCTDTPHAAAILPPRRPAPAGMVERDHCRRVLAPVEHAGAQVDAAPPLLPARATQSAQVLCGCVRGSVRACVCPGGKGKGGGLGGGGGGPCLPWHLQCNPLLAP